MEALEELITKINPSLDTLEKVIIERIEKPLGGSFLLRLTHADLIWIYTSTKKDYGFRSDWFILQAVYHDTLAGDELYELYNFSAAPSPNFIPELGRRTIFPF